MATIKQWACGFAAAGLLWFGVQAHASIAVLMEDPYGEFGSFNPTGHAAIYLDHVCADTPTQLRICGPGEAGVVISRYHKIDGYDWVAVPLIPYLYAVQSVNEIPEEVTPAEVSKLRDTYRRAELERLVPDRADGGVPGGEWTQLVGGSYDRTIHGFAVETTPQQDERFVALMNDRRNISHFNLLFHNCADFSRAVLDLYFPHAIHRNLIADLGVTTPKDVAKDLARYGEQHPELHLSAFYIPQVAGDLPRSHPIHGVTESLVKSKRYIVPMALLMPHVTGGVVLAYLVEGRGALPKEQIVEPINGHLDFANGM